MPSVETSAAFLNVAKFLISVTFDEFHSQIQHDLKNTFY